MALTLVAAGARPSRAEPLSTRLDPRFIAPEHSKLQERPWGAPQSRDVVVSDQKTRGPLSLVVLGGGVVAAGVGTVFGLRNHSALSDYHSAQTAAARADARDRAQSAATIANVSWVAAGVLIAAGLGMLFFTDI